MRALTTIVNQLLCMLIWFNFTHHFLTPKEDTRKREAKIYLLWTLLTILTATVFWHDTELKTLITPLLLYLSFCYTYLYDRKRFIIAIILILLAIFISEILSILLFITIFHRQLETLSWFDNLLLMPLLLGINYFILSAVLKRKSFINDLPNISLLFVLLQIPIMLMIDLSYQQHYLGPLNIAIWILLIFTLFFQVFLWRKRDQYYGTKKQQIINQRLKLLYEQELSAHLKQKHQEQLQRKIRHDLLNEIQLVTYMEIDKRIDG